MSIRPFWINCQIDGRKNNLEGGPKAKDGLMHTHFYIRNEGDIKKALTVNCFSEDGKLKIVVYDSNGNPVHTEESVY